MIAGCPATVAWALPRGLAEVCVSGIAEARARVVAPTSGPYRRTSRPRLPPRLRPCLRGFAARPRLMLS